MGTNYYLHQQTSLPEPDHEIVLHIGKGSTGWCFSLHVMPEREINDLSDWLALIERRGGLAVIKDEYGDEVQLQELIDIITDRRRDVSVEESFNSGKKTGWYQHHKDFKDYLDRSHADVGPNNLLRHRLSGTVVRHGSGTWDCVLGEFS